MAFFSCTKLSFICMNSEQPPTLLLGSGGEDPFWYVPTSCTIYVPQGSSDAYAIEPWNQFPIKGYGEEVKLTDGEAFSNGSARPVSRFTYTREFTNTDWQALYVPFILAYDDWQADFDIALLNDVHQFDDDGNGTVDRTELECLMLGANSYTVPNCPYLIRAHETGTKTFSQTNAVLSASTENAIDCTSITTKYTFTGTYAGVSGANMPAGGYYALANGELRQTDSDAADLGSFRWYLRVNSRENEANIIMPTRMKILVRDPAGNATGIESPVRNDKAASGIYSLDGRLIRKEAAGLDGLSKGIYIVNGKKVVIR